MRHDQLMAAAVSEARLIHRSLVPDRREIRDCLALEMSQMADWVPVIKVALFCGLRCHIDSTNEHQLFAVPYKIVLDILATKY